MPEISSEDSFSNSKNAITHEKSRSVELGRNEFPTWRITRHPEIGRIDANYRSVSGGYCPDCRSGNWAAPCASRKNALTRLTRDLPKS